MALTASAMVEDRRKALDASCDFFIAKPIAPDFEQSIQRILDVGEA